MADGGSATAPRGRRLKLRLSTAVEAEGCDDCSPSRRLARYASAAVLTSFGRNLIEAWSASFETLDIPTGSRVLLAGPDVEGLALEIGAPISQASFDLVMLGSGAPEVPDQATAAATGLGDGVVDVAVMLSAWDGPVQLAVMVREAVRVVRPGGLVILGEPDASALDSAPAVFRSALLYQRFPEIAVRQAERTLPGSAIGVEAVRAGLNPVTLDPLAVPIAVLADVDSYVEAVRSGLWPGSDLLDDVALDGLLRELRMSLSEPTRFPVVDYQPWWVARGVRPG